MVYVGQAGILINLVLMILNLLPIPPLDGSRIVFSFAPVRLTAAMAQFEVYGFLLLVILLATGILAKILGPIVFTLYKFILITFQL